MAIRLINSLWYGKYLNILNLILNPIWGGGGNLPERGTFLNISLMVQDTVKKFYRFIFTLFKIVLHALKFSFVFICCHGNYFFQLVNELRNEQSHLDSMILANLVGGTYGFKSEINQKHIMHSKSNFCDITVMSFFIQPCQK